MMNLRLSLASAFTLASSLWRSLFADHHFSGLDDHRDLIAGLHAEPFHRGAGDRRDDRLAAHVNLDFGHDCAQLDIGHGSFELIACAEFHRSTSLTLTGILC